MGKILAGIKGFDGITVERLRELYKADKDGRVLILPAKTVFELTWDAGAECNLNCPVTVDGQPCCKFCDHGELFVYETECKQEHITELGKTVFLTCEEAEKALAEMKREEGTDGTDDKLG